MANVQIDNGNFTRFSNEFLEEMVKVKLSGQEVQLILFVFRKTFGFKGKHKGDFISLSQISEGLNISRVRSSQILTSLVDKNMINSSIHRKGGTNFLSINKNYESWKGYSKPVIQICSLCEKEEDKTHDYYLQKHHVAWQYNEKNIPVSDKNSPTILVCPSCHTDIHNEEISLESVKEKLNSSDLEVLRKNYTVISQNLNTCIGKTNESVKENLNHKRKKETFKDTIKEREILFANELIPFKEKYGRDLLVIFYYYWTETNKKGKMRFEGEKFFDINRRLATFKRNQDKKSYGKPKKQITPDQREKFDSAIDGYFNNEKEE